MTRPAVRSSREIVGLPALGQVGRDPPLVGVDPLDVACPAQRLQAPHMGSDVRRGITAQTLDGADGLLQMHRPADRCLPCRQSPGCCGPRCADPPRPELRRHNHASLDILGADRVHLEVMDAPIHAVDHQPDPLTHLVAAQPLVEHTAPTIGSGIFSG